LCGGRNARLSQCDRDRHPASRRICRLHRIRPPERRRGDHSVLSGGAKPVPTYGLRLRGEEDDKTSVHVFLRDKGTEREVLVDRCSDADVDTRSPEGLLLPIDCDGRRLVLRDERGKLVMTGTAKPTTIGPVPETSTALAR
jgi:hypothetical protein